MSSVPVVENPCDMYSKYRITEDIPLDELETLCTAYKDKRVVVFYGDIVPEKGKRWYFINDNQTWSILINDISRAIFKNGIRKFYSKQQQAEAALKGMEGK